MHSLRPILRSKIRNINLRIWRKKEQVVEAPRQTMRRISDIDRIKKRQELVKMKAVLKTASQLIKESRKGIKDIELAINKLDILDW